ncbi:hypothetical protein GCM10009601_51930 [Streptomyces thermospinosisporus]|mgnify:CR=1 FL=1|uniref:Uncharacterized protein n=2 Tax=Streptomyces thermospinosisporus TaxID=161482 RepID=A0ABP4JXV7_9ACTN
MGVGPTVPLMVHVITARARAYVLRGDWVADCPRHGCANAEFVCDRANPRDPRSPRTVRKGSFYCSNCHEMAPIDWPDNAAEIMEVLELRPVPQTRNWFPEGHESTRLFPQGQTVEDLREENREHGVPGSREEAVG